MVTTPGFADDAKQCPAPENVRFNMKGEDRSFNNDARYIVFRQDEKIDFTASLQSAGTITWDYGDDGSEALRSSDGKYQKTVHAFTVPGIYEVKLSATKNCGGNANGVASEVSGTVHIYDKEIASYGVCKEYTAIQDNVLMQYDEHALMSLIVLLRNDRNKREEMKEIVEQSLEELKKVEKINDDPAKQKEIDRLTDRLMDTAGADGKDEAVHLNALKAELTNIKGIQKGKADDEKAKADDDIELLKKLILALEKRIMKQCDQDTAKAESRLRKKGNRLARIYTSLEQSKENKDAYDKNKAGIDKQIADNQALLNSVKGVTPITYNDLFQTYDDYNRYFFKFYLGYEFASTVNELMKKGVPRIGFSVQYRAWERDVPDAKPAGFWDGFGFYGIHTTFHALVTGSAEQDTVLSSPTGSSLASSPTSTLANAAEKKALEGNVDFFVPLYRTARFNDRKLWGYFGPVISLGVKKADDVVDSSGNMIDRYDRRRYAGVMLAFNPELYTEVLYGKTTGLKSERLEVRAQMPVYRFNNESRLLAGVIANLGVNHRVASETDVIRIYITWNVNFENVYEYLSGHKIDNSQ